MKYILTLLTAMLSCSTVLATETDNQHYPVFSNEISDSLLTAGFKYNSSLREFQRNDHWGWIAEPNQLITPAMAYIKNKELKIGSIKIFYDNSRIITAIYVENIGEISCAKFNNDTNDFSHKVKINGDEYRANAMCENNPNTMSHIIYIIDPNDTYAYGSLAITSLMKSDFAVSVSVDSGDSFLLPTEGLKSSVASFIEETLPKP